MSCSTAEKPDTCFIKFPVYKIKCLSCGAIYIGETERTIRTRILEHTRNNNSHFYQHMNRCHANENMNFKWSILATNKYEGTRLAIEALHIKKETNIMNGCEGAVVLPYLLWFIHSSCFCFFFLLIPFISLTHAHTPTHPP